MKKIIFSLLAIAMLTLGFSGTAFAEDTTVGTYKASDGSTIVVTAGSASDDIGDYDFNIGGKVYKNVGYNGGLPIFEKTSSDNDGTTESIHKNAVSTDGTIEFSDQQFVFTGYNSDNELTTGFIKSESGAVLLRDNNNNLYLADYQSEDSSMIYYKIIEKFIRINSQPTSIPTTGTAALTIDTGTKLSVKPGKTYQFKITASSKPTFTSGNMSIFKVIYNGQKGSDYYFVVKAVGKPGQAAGFYVNGAKSPCTIGTIS